MKRVILVSYHFPPCGGKAVQRALKLVKYLPEFGWEPIVFTMPFTGSGVPTDLTLLDELPPGIQICRPKFRNGWNLIPHDIRKYVYSPIPDRFRTWADAVKDKLFMLIKTSGARALITTSPTHSTQLLGLAVKEETGIPWIADFRDPWTGHPDFSEKKHADRMREMEASVLEAADAVVGVYPKILRDFEASVSRVKLHLLENGYDEDDFRLVDRNRKTGKTSLWLGYNGTVSDFHNPVPLLEPLESLVKAGGLEPDTLRLVFTTGESGSKRFAPFHTLRKTGILKVHNYLPHTESLARLSEMDVSLLLLTKGINIYPGKVFEYFYLGNPILSLSTPGDDLDMLIRETGGGMVIDYRDSEAVKTAVLKLIDMKKNRELPQFSPNREKINRFSRRRIAERYAEILEKISGARH